MENKNKIETLDEILFEHRNKDYGAYLLRKSYQKHLQRSVLLGSSLFLIGISAPFIYGKIAKKTETVHAVDLTLQNVQSEIEDKFEKPKIIEEIKPEVHQLKSEIFIPPTPVIDEAEIDEVIPKQTDLENVVISTVKQDGATSTGIIDDTPPEAPAGGDNVIVELKPEIDNTIHISVEQQPEFGNGMNDLYAYLSKNLRYPSAAQNNNVQGKVFLSFVVERDGSVTDVSVLKGIGFGCDEEAVRVVSKMSKWRAGKQNGREVRVRFTLPVTFKLD